MSVEAQSGVMSTFGTVMETLPSVFKAVPNDDSQASLSLRIVTGLIGIVNGVLQWRSAGKYWPELSRFPAVMILGGVWIIGYAIYQMLRRVRALG